MGFDVTKVHVGAARIWTGVTAAVSGTPPTYIAHTNGVPGSGTEIGITEGDCTVSYQLKKGEMQAEQSLAIVDVYAIEELYTISFTMKESNANALKAALDSSVGYDSSGGDGFYFGGGTAVLAPMNTCVFYSSPRRDNPAKYFVGQIYEAYTMDPFTFPMGKKTESKVKVTLKAIADLTRTPKDQLGYFRREN